jgi:DHA2 family multidrug resistance protein-like MFS transporter
VNILTYFTGAKPVVYEDGLPGGLRIWALITVTLGITLAIMDGTVANVALPTIGRAFSVSPASSIWIVNAYQLSLVMCLLPFAAVGEIVGYRRVYLLGLALFTTASLFCATSTSLTELTLARIVQGVGGAAIMSVNLALIRYIFPASKMGWAIGMNAMVAAIASTIGPTIASAVLWLGSWPFLFLINVPFGAAAFVLGYRALPFSHKRSGVFDWRSAFLCAVTFGTTVLIAILIGHQVRVAFVVAVIVVAAILAYQLIRRQRAVTAPMLPLDLFKIPLFSLSIATSICAFAVQMLTYVSLPFYYQLNLGFSAVHAGLLLAAWPLALACVASLSGRAADRYSPALLGCVGMTVLAIGLFLMAMLPGHASVGNVLWRMGLCGIGFGIFQPANNRAIMWAGPKNRSGAASGMLGTARVLGQSLGAAVAGFCLQMGGSHGAYLGVCCGSAIAMLAAMVSLLRARIR